MKTTMDLGEVREVRFIENVENDGSKFSSQLLSLVDFSRGNNYESSHIEVRVYDDNTVEVSTFCVNDYGRKVSNENYTQVTKSDLPYFTAKKLGLV